MAGRHRRPNAWRRALSGLGLRRTGVTAARAAALNVEVIALRATVASLRADLAEALARSAELDATLARNAELETQLAAATAAAAPVPALTLDLPLMKVALAREIGPPLTRDMAAALASPDRGEDTASVEIVLADLPESELLDPIADRDGDLRDIAAGIAAIPEPIRKSA